MEVNGYSRPKVTYAKFNLAKYMKLSLGQRDGNGSRHGDLKRTARLVFIINQYTAAYAAVYEKIRPVTALRNFLNH